MDNASGKMPTRDDVPKRGPFDFRKVIRLHPIVSGLVTLAVCWFVIRAIALQVNGPSSLSETYYLEEQKISISSEWRKTAVMKKEEGIDKTTCIARVKIQNLDDVRLLNVRSIDLILQDGNGIELHSKEHYFGLGGKDLKPGESTEFTMKYWVPTGFLRYVRELSTLLYCDFKPMENLFQDLIPQTDFKAQEKKQ
jgi:hypothetical protein